MADLRRRLPPKLRPPQQRLQEAEREIRYLRSRLGALPPHNLPFQPIAAASDTVVECGPRGFERESTSTAWETLFVHDGQRSGRVLTLRLYVMASDGSTAGQVQVVDESGGEVLPDHAGVTWAGAIATGTTTLTLISAQIGLTRWKTGVPMRVGIQVKRTAGAGTLRLAVGAATS